MRTKIEWRSSSKENYNDFCKKHPNITLSYDDWKNIIYLFNESFRNYILESGDKAKFPYGFGEFTINKKKRKKFKVVDGKEYVNLAIDWKKTREKGKRVYNFNYHTEGYFFGWMWIKEKARFKHSDVWYFKPSRITSRLINHYIKTDEKYQHIYKQWKL
jgi:nucleoid DNA-binding protein